MLIDIKRNNAIIPAVAIGTKMGHIFVLERATGKPVFPIEERDVMKSGIDGEESSAKQPFPVLPRPLGLQQLSVEDAWGPTPELKKQSEDRIARYVNKGIFTPPSIQGTIVTPGNVGGIHWGGMCFDPQKQLLFTNINWLAALIRLIPREQLDADNANADKKTLRAETGMQTGSPYVMKRDYFFDLDGENFYGQTKPPWGTLNAVDLASGENKWQVPLGFMMDTTKYPDSKKWGSLNFGGAITTAGNLVFVAATRDGYFRAFDSSSGELLWESLLPAGGQATPMTYSYRKKQYVVIAAGGHGKFMTKMGDYIIAYTVD
jgi:quinoprotein glucose dehydrogenase